MCKLPLEFFLDIYRERERKRESGKVGKEGWERVVYIKSLPCAHRARFTGPCFSRTLINLFTAIRKHKRTRGCSFISGQTTNEYKKYRFRFEQFFPSLPFFFPLFSLSSFHINDYEFSYFESYKVA